MAFQSIHGHQRVLSLLSRSLDAGTLPNSLIFSGPEGVGKRSTALALAQALNCESAPAGCGTCSSCRRIARGLHPDVSVVAPGEAGSIKIEQVRDVIDQAIFRPFEGRKRVTIIDNAEALVDAAQNALLKTLEEPPASSVFILVTAHPDSLLPTVRSRCSQIRFGRLSASDVAEVLEQMHKYSKREALAVAAASEGSVRRALDARAGDTSDARDDAEALLRSARTRGDARARIERAKGLLKSGGGPASAAERDYLALRLEALSSLTRDLSILTTGASPELIANIDLRQELEGLTKSFDAERLLGMFAQTFQEAVRRRMIW